jgi:hypothetical protein
MNLRHLSILAILGLGGFGCSTNRISLNRSSLWKRRMRNKELMALHKSKSENRQTSNNKEKEGE